MLNNNDLTGNSDENSTPDKDVNQLILREKMVLAYLRKLTPEQRLAIDEVSKLDAVEDKVNAVNAMDDDTRRAMREMQNIIDYGHPAGDEDQQRAVADDFASLPLERRLLAASHANSSQWDEKLAMMVMNELFQLDYLGRVMLYTENGEGGIGVFFEDLKHILRKSIPRLYSPGSDLYVWLKQLPRYGDE